MAHRPLGRPDAADVIAQDGHAAAVALLAQTLEDLGLLTGCAGVLAKPRRQRRPGAAEPRI
jgi:hypothetical protein